MHPRRRWYQHRYDLRHGKHASERLQEAVGRYGLTSARYSLLEMHDTIDDALESEEWLIAYLRSLGADVVNVQIGGLAGKQKHFYEIARTPQALAKKAQSMTGHVVTEETRARISAANTGKLRTPEVRAKLSAAKTGKKMSPEALEKARARRWDEEHKIHMREVMTGRKMSPEAIAKSVATRAANRAARLAGEDIPVRKR